MLGRWTVKNAILKREILSILWWSKFYVKGLLVGGEGSIYKFYDIITHDFGEAILSGIWQWTEEFNLYYRVYHKQFYSDNSSYL